MELLAVLVGDDRTTRGSCIGSNLEDQVRIKVQAGCPTATLRSEEICRLTTTPPSYMHPTMVVPVLVALGRGTPLACRAALRL